MRKCLLMGFFGYSNLGDDLLFAEAVSKIPKDYELYILVSKNSTLSKTSNRKVHFLYSKLSLYTRYYDLVLFNGGGLFPSTEFSLKHYCFLFSLYSISKRIVINGIGIVPKKGYKSNFLFASFLRLASYVSVRDEVSQKYVNKLLNKENTVNCHDIYFGRNIRVCQGGKDTRKGLLVCLAYPFSGEELNNEKCRIRYNSFVSVLQETIYEMSFYTNKHISFLPFYKGSDDKLINDILRDDRFKNSKVLKVGEDYDINNIDKVFSEYELGLCMRYHSFVLSIRNCLPFVGICYDYKSESLIKEIGIDYIGVRYGIRKNNFFGIEKDLNRKEISDSLSWVIKNKDKITGLMDKARMEYFNSVIQSYKNIFDDFVFVGE